MFVQSFCDPPFLKLHISASILDLASLLNKVIAIYVPSFVDYLYPKMPFLSDFDEQSKDISNKNDSSNDDLS
ncbi:hypothetical protein J6TS1_29400 [Siminovitchia terrae]|uniref:Uncharacterized protein n=1 Tax=Siminovitchia terrae TaxID=1914933 RepID=A0ABQ4KYL9_SIMTE|nr:hypothetical protein J6TS1_29400 [Siminovitchia terrae]